jgi:hypothetical protein
MSQLRNEILAAEETAWHALHDACARLTEAQWITPGATGDWSPKDLLAHVGCWAAEAARQLECIRAGSPSRGPELDAFNAASHDTCKDLTVHEVIAMASAAHHRLQEEIDQVAPVALSGKVVEMIHECADRHYREHLGQLLAFIDAGIDSGIEAGRPDA